MTSRGRRRRERSIAVIGDLNMDVVVEIADVSTPLQALWREATEFISVAVGGAGFFVAQAAVEAGIQTTLFGRVGSDPFGGLILKRLRQSSVDACVDTDPELETGKVVLFHDLTDRRVMLSSRGANVRLESTAIVAEKIARAAVLFVSGYALLERPQSTAALRGLEHARAAGSMVVLDVVPHRVAREGLPEDYHRFLGDADAVVIEAGTARRVFAASSTGSDEELAQELCRRYELAILRVDNERQIVAGHGAVGSLLTGYGASARKIGYLDGLSVRTVFDYLSEA